MAYVDSVLFHLRMQRPRLPSIPLEFGCATPVECDYSKSARRVRDCLDADPAMDGRHSAGSQGSPRDSHFAPNDWVWSPDASCGYLAEDVFLLLTCDALNGPWMGQRDRATCTAHSTQHVRLPPIKGRQRGCLSDQA